MSYHSYLFLTLAAIPSFQSDNVLNRLFNGTAALIIVGIVGLCLLALIVMLVSLLPQATEQSRAALLRQPWRAFFIGLANYLFLGGISLVLLSTEAPPLSVIGLIIIAFLATVTAFGLAGLASQLGTRLGAMQEQATSPLKQLIWGTLVIEAAGFLPFLGWFLVTPLMLMLSFGAAVLAWRNRKRVDEPWQTTYPATDDVPE